MPVDTDRYPRDFFVDAPYGHRLADDALVRHDEKAFMIVGCLEQVTASFTFIIAFGAGVAKFFHKCRQDISARAVIFGKEIATILWNLKKIIDGGAFFCYDNKERKPMEGTI